VGNPNDTTWHSGQGTSDPQIIALTVSALKDVKDGFVKVPKDEMPKSKHMAIGLYYKWGYLVNVYVFPDGYVYAKDPHNLDEVYKSIEPSDYSTYYGIFYNLYQNDKF
jgi:hypothetical protein